MLFETYWTKPAPPRLVHPKEMQVGIQLFRVVPNMLDDAMHMCSTGTPGKAARSPERSSPGLTPSEVHSPVAGQSQRKVTGIWSISLLEDPRYFLKWP